jgi:hypothetical protein
MKRSVAVVAFVFALAAGLSAKGETTKITIVGSDLKTPIEIVDPAILKNFQVWAGPGSGSEGFIVDSATTSAPTPPRNWRRYDVAFFSGKEAPIYVVSYQFDPSSARGWVYLPGTPLNLRTFARNGIWDWWLPASQAWERVARPLIASASTR